jgi:hypothetical protein
MNTEIERLIKHRLEFGAKKYGKENITSDGRDFIEEALEEALDCCIYLASRLLEIRKMK